MRKNELAGVHSRELIQLVNASYIKDSPRISHKRLKVMGGKMCRTLS